MKNFKNIINLLILSSLILIVLCKIIPIYSSIIIPSYVSSIILVLFFVCFIFLTNGLDLISTDSQIEKKIERSDGVLILAKILNKGINENFLSTIALSNFIYETFIEKISIISIDCSQEVLYIRCKNRNDIEIKNFINYMKEFDQGIEFTLFNEE